MGDKQIKLLTRIAFILCSGRKVFNKLSFRLKLHASAEEEERKNKRKCKDEGNKKLMRSLREDDVYKNEESAKRAYNVANYEKAILVAKE